MLACKRKLNRCVYELIEGSDLNEVNDEGLPAILIALEFQNNTIIEDLIDGACE